MKRNCNGCRAFYIGRFSGTCELGYKIGDSKVYKGITSEYKPLEECPKPKTYDQLFEAKIKTQSI